MENKKDMPLGFAFQLGMNEKALNNFTKMTDGEKRQVLEAARSVSSKQEMRGIVNDIANMD